ncbi:Uncharacterised protein [Mycobacteroides abscessus subsp. abscessus]|nr:Uncharacterised protein [Mycobacteroides abscessus subsp. abscessus]SIH69834.1 Uncharacterised protein [Mycobacteroides abscessus subsp. abscessus]SIH93319.1 Uncharacterised protein [Mycobacteroides abscessus subsp. abscessus]SIJ01809.1 Uncharacterised protein [Mycobacteroides abscessus subsp. abscessus]SIJ21447.1 Uncharacterised protein [Mycobacteroides abscessus subsp. abscessus]
MLGVTSRVKRRRVIHRTHGAPEIFGHHFDAQRGIGEHRGVGGAHTAGAAWFVVAPSWVHHAGSVHGAMGRFSWIAADRT